MTLTSKQHALLTRAAEHWEDLNAAERRAVQAVLWALLRQARSA